MMKIIVGILGIVCVLFLSVASVIAQMSQGGQPIEISSGEGVDDNFIWFKSPVASSAKFSKQETGDSENYLKPLRFAHSFDVALNTTNTGTWINHGKYKVWKLGIESTDAYSINLIFRNFLLPPGARLFIYNPDRSDIIGAFTENNNTETGIFPTLPVAGDKVIVQYEELIDSNSPGQFEISRISHDFVGITLKSDDPRRPMKQPADYCNIDINCKERWVAGDTKNSICRVFINGDELCTGVLLNNTSNDGKPYVLTAGHCIENSYQAQVSLFLFNYESPYCGSIDGDNKHSISGSTLRANFDSLDFSLVELSVAPPNYYRPYYAGWDASAYVASKTFTIHHPMGDIKKIAIDNDSPVSATYSKDYVSSSFWRVNKWDAGVTEIGSSGGPLFNENYQVIGSLTGGAAQCSDPRNDYFEKISKSWNYKSMASKQLKYWLDPINTGEKKINGYNPFTGASKCSVFSNFSLADTTQLKRISQSIPSNGYYSGSNREAYSEFAEKFSGIKSATLNGVSIGIARLYMAGSTNDVLLTVNVYSGDDVPATLIHTENFSMKQMAKEAMNYLAFNEPVTTSGNFFVSYSLGLLNPTDTIALYHAKRASSDNSFFIKTSSGWTDYKTLASSTSGSSLLMEMAVCNADFVDNSVILESAVANAFKVFPNPLHSHEKITISNSQEMYCTPSVSIFNLLGQSIPFQIISENPNQIELQPGIERTGIYFLQIETEGETFIHKFSVVP